MVSFAQSLPPTPLSGDVYVKWTLTTAGPEALQACLPMLTGPGLARAVVAVMPIAAMTSTTSAMNFFMIFLVFRQDRTRCPSGAGQSWLSSPRAARRHREWQDLVGPLESDWINSAILA